ncbi:MAG: hypothetical protein ACD_63C00031G0001 [uncultured bacterium]|nr:MAG: hypothetical protein ACD_63C00031G0001 [uncultured bacterium]
MAKIKAAFLALTLLLSIGCCTSAKTAGLLVPHHLFVENYIEEFYALNGNKEVETIILLSPNHYNYGYSYLQTTTKLDGAVLDTDFIESLSGSSALKIDSTNFELEHGITNHLGYISEFFPNAKVIPIRIKEGTPESALDSLINILPKDALVIASIDFSHEQAEGKALESDVKIIKWLEDPDKFTLGTIRSLAETGEDCSTNIDSPESLYVLLRLMPADYNFTLWKRTSSASLSDNADATENTSHIFGVLR